MKIKNGKKFIRSILIIFIMTLMMSLLISKSTLSHKETEYKTVCVSQGDTLWNIAKTNQADNEYYKNKDIRYIVNDIKEVNNLKNSNIVENQKLLIPVL